MCHWLFISQNQSHWKIWDILYGVHPSGSYTAGNGLLTQHTYSTLSFSHFFRSKAIVGVQLIFVKQYESHIAPVDHGVHSSCLYISVYDVDWSLQVFVYFPFLYRYNTRREVGTVGLFFSLYFFSYIWPRSIKCCRFVPHFLMALLL